MAFDEDVGATLVTGSKCSQAERARCLEAGWERRGDSAALILRAPGGERLPAAPGGVRGLRGPRAALTNNCPVPPRRDAGLPYRVPEPGTVL